MKYRKLRIAWTVGWGVVAVLLIVLWVRSYWRFGSVEIRVSSTGELGLMSVQGCTYWAMLSNQEWNWKASTQPLVRDNQPTIFEASAVNAELNWRGRFGFGLSHIPDKQFVSFPHWFLVLFSAAFAAAPWLRWRFSLRTLLIAMTLVAVVLGVVVYAVR